MWRRHYSRAWRPGGREHLGTIEEAAYCMDVCSFISQQLKVLQHLLDDFSRILTGLYIQSCFLIVFYNLVSIVFLKCKLLWYFHAWNISLLNCLHGTSKFFLVCLRVIYLFTPCKLFLDWTPLFLEQRHRICNFFLNTPLLVFHLASV